MTFGSGLTVIVRFCEPVAPLSSVTVSFAVNAPVVVYVCEAVTPLAVAPSSNGQAYDAIVPSLSEEAEPLNATASGTIPELGVAVADAVGGTFGVPPPGAMTKRLIDCGSSVALRVEPERAMSETCS